MLFPFMICSQKDPMTWTHEVKTHFTILLMGSQGPWTNFISESLHFKVSEAVALYLMSVQYIDTLVWDYVCFK